MGRGHGLVTITRGARSGALAVIYQINHQNGYPVTAVMYGLIRTPHQAIFGRLTYVVQRVMEHFKSTSRGQGIPDVRHQKIQGWEARVHKRGATVEDVTDQEKIFNRAIIL